MGALYLTFLLLQHFFCPSEELLILGGLAFAFFIGLHVFFIRRWSRPLEEMIKAVTPYQGDYELTLPKQIVPDWEKKNAFTPLSFALNSLTEKIHKQMEGIQKKDKEMESILESLNEGVVAFNASAKVIFANQIACKILDVPHDKIIGKSLGTAQSLSKLKEKCYELILHALQTSEPILEKWTVDGLYLDLVASPLIHQAGALLVIQDKASDYKILEVGKTFITNASHELRTPITIIRGFAEMLQNDSRLSLQTKLDITDKIVKTCDRFDKLVKSLLTIADLENVSHDRFRVCNLLSILENCKHLLLIAYPQVQVDISSSSDAISVLGDADLLDLAFMNLLENAVKYSVGPAKIQIAIAQEDKHTEIFIKDQGIGIPSEDLPHIFDRFYRVDKARSRKSGGVGLGLSMVKTIVEKHGGEISVASEIGKGSTFGLKFH